MQYSGSPAAVGPTMLDKIWASCPTEVARLGVGARGWKLHHHFKKVTFKIIKLCQLGTTNLNTLANTIPNMPMMVSGKISYFYITYGSRVRGPKCETGANGWYSWGAQGLKWAAVPKEKCEVPTAMNTKILLACYAVCFGEQLSYCRWTMLSLTFPKALPECLYLSSDHNITYQRL
jgi:hypothetical protein